MTKEEKPICVYVLLFKHEDGDVETVGAYSTYELVEQYRKKYSKKFFFKNKRFGELLIYHVPFDYGVNNETSEDMVDSSEDNKRS